MKKLLPMCLLLVTVFSVTVKAQNAPLNKQQTLDYIEKLFKVNYEASDNLKVTMFKLEEKILSWQSNVAGLRIDLSKIEVLELKSEQTNGISYFNIYYEEEKKIKYVLTWIRVESDAKRLKKALEHLIEILKTEKSTDPFGE